MQSNPPPVIILYRQSISEDARKQFGKHWQQEPQEVKEFFSTLYQAIKQTNMDYSQLFGDIEDLDTSSLSLCFNDMSAISYKPIFENSFDSESVKNLLQELNESTKKLDQSAFYSNNSITSISKLCSRLQGLKLDNSVLGKLEQSFIQLTQRTHQR